jgi:quercetin dioxygenase-like cupin family protein
MSRRTFNRGALAAAVITIASARRDGEAAAARENSSKQSTRHEVINQLLLGEPQRQLTLVDVVYPPGTGSPPHLHPNGVLAFVISGSIPSKMGDEPERAYQAGEAWWEPRARCTACRATRALQVRRGCSPFTLLLRKLARRI